MNALIHIYLLTWKKNSLCVLHRKLMLAPCKRDSTTKKLDRTMCKWIYYHIMIFFTKLSICSSDKSADVNFHIYLSLGTIIILYHAFQYHASWSSKHPFWLPPITIKTKTTSLGKKRKQTTGSKDQVNRPDLLNQLKQTSVSSEANKDDQWQRKMKPLIKQSLCVYIERQCNQYLEFT